MLQEIGTAGLPAGDRMPYWTEIASKFIAPLHIEAQCPETFDARLYRATFRDCELVSPCSSPARIWNGSGQDAGALNLQLQHVGTSTNDTAGRTSILREGDFLLFDPALPLQVSFPEPTQTIVLRLPLAYSEERLPHLREMAGIPVRGDRGAGALFSNFLRTAWAQLLRNDDDWADTLSDVIWPLLELAYATGREPAGNSSARQTRLRAMFDLIDDQLCDPGFDTRAIAARLGVSTRYIQLLFAELATTPSAYIQDKRLQRAASRLEREGTGTTITSVAFDVGFNDLSSFCRSFRRRYAVSPSDYRAGRHREGTAPRPNSFQLNSCRPNSFPLNS